MTELKITMPMEEGYCREQELQALLGKYQDGELSDEMVARLTVHLETCPHCRKELAGFDRVMSALRALPEIETDGFFTARVMAGVRSARLKPRAWFVRLALPSLLYAAVFLVFLGMSWWGIGILNEPRTLPLPAVAANMVQEIDVAGVFSQSQQLSLLQVQDRTFSLLTEGDSGENLRKQVGE